MQNFGAIVLAAGKGKRMNAKGVNKVAMPLVNKPMISHTVDLLTNLKIDPIIVVVGYAKKSVMELLEDRVIFAEQKKRLGTSHATWCGLKKIPKEIKNVIVLNGDDSAFYTTDIIKTLIDTHSNSSAAVTFLTIELANPYGLGRVIRDVKGKVTAVVEEKDATETQRSIKEINPACYIFRVDFLLKYLKGVKKSKITGEYYLVSLIEIAYQNKEKIETVLKRDVKWRGVNTQEELKEAEKLFLNV